MEKYSKEWINQKIKDGRDFAKKAGFMEMDEELCKSDQELHLPQPPLFKDPVSSDIIKLPRDFNSLDLETDIVAIIYNRKSYRVYTEASISLLELSYLLWAQQGVKEIRGKSYATLRTVPCGGARHEFELYFTVKNVEGLKPGYYHYLPQTHSIECLKEDNDLDKFISDSTCGQSWISKAPVVFYYSMVPYRAEWRYSIWTHNVTLIDAGHITQNLYIACSSLKDLGTCAIAAVDYNVTNNGFGVDGEEEFFFYCAPVGRVNVDNKKDEEAFYQFVKDQNL